MDYECNVCNQICEPDGDVDLYGRNIPVEGNGVTRCESCNEWIHEACLAADKKLCKSCATCDVYGCGNDASLDGIFVDKGTITPAASVGWSPQELLCPRCLVCRAVAIKNAVAA